MVTDQWEIRLVRQSDNHLLARALKEILIEMNVPDQGTAFADPEIDAIYDAYQQNKANYWVVCHGDYIFGGASIALLHDGPGGYLSYRKCIFSPSKRKGVGEPNDSKMPYTS